MSLSRIVQVAVREGKNNLSIGVEAVYVLKMCIFIMFYFILIIALLGGVVLYGP